MKTMKTKKTYETPSMKEHELKHRTSLLTYSMNSYGMNRKLVVPETDDDNDVDVVKEAW